MVKSILIIDDDMYISKILEKFLNREGFETEAILKGRAAVEVLRKKKFDAVLCDIRLPDINGVELLQLIRQIDPDVPVIMMTAYAEVQSAVQAIKLGAYDYVSKPVYPEEIVRILRQAWKSGQEPKESGKPSGEFISGNSLAMKELVRLARLVAPTGLSVLIQGETGSGKEYIARLIHENSKRKDKNFIAIDCGALPSELAASELFGHIKGSFTGAISNKTGYFEQAGKGTIFLDEIGNLPYDTQVKLLRAIQQKVISRVGDTSEIPVDVRIITATNRDLLQATTEGHFREDLYHRINEFKISIPPIRERGDDVMIFANHFLKEANKELSKDVKGFDDETERIFRSYEWYGNLRELRNVIRRSTLITDTDMITPESLPEEIRFTNIKEKTAIFNNSDNMELKDAIQEAEKMVIQRALNDSNYNKTKTAQMLNIDRKTLYNKIRQLGIDLKE